MSRRIAFLRGINLGGRNVKSAGLVNAFEAMGFEDVATFLASGNVVFDGRGADDAGLETRIEDGLASSLGYEVSTFVRSSDELAAVVSPARVSSSPLAGTEGAKVHVMFLRGEAPEELAGAAADLRGPDDDFVVAGRELYWLRRGGISDSAAWRPLEKALDGRGTMRTLNTVQRLVARFCEGGSSRQR